MVLHYNILTLAWCLLCMLQSVSLYGASKTTKQQPKDTEIVYDVAPAEEVRQEPVKEHTCHVRILLNERNIDEKGTWDFESADGFTIGDELKPTRTAGYDTPSIIIGHADGDLYINGRRSIKKKLHVTPRNGKITANGRTYQGSMFIVAYEDSWLLINVINLEEYVYSVLQTESWPGWPLEVNKVFAITSRTYAIAMMMRAEGQNLPYHLRDTNAHQTYEGMHSNTDLWRAVEKTKGLFVGYNNKPILAMFDSCCGGVITAHIKHFDFSKAPYLARTYPCTHCKRCKIYTWEARYDLDHLERIINGSFPHLTKLKKVEVAKHDKAGLADTVHIVTRKHKEVISGKKLYSLLKEVKSFAYEINMHKDTVHIKGKGYGHHLGLCQWGAREMVRDGADCQSILRFYYPGTCFMRLG